ALRALGFISKPAPVVPARDTRPAPLAPPALHEPRRYKQRPPRHGVEERVEEEWSPDHANGERSERCRPHPLGAGPDPAAAVLDGVATPATLPGPPVRLRRDEDESLP